MEYAVALLAEEQRLCGVAAETGHIAPHPFRWIAHQPGQGLHGFVAGGRSHLAQGIGCVPAHVFVLVDQGLQQARQRGRAARTQAIGRPQARGLLCVVQGFQQGWHRGLSHGSQAIGGIELHGFGRVPQGPGQGGQRGGGGRSQSAQLIGRSEALLFLSALQGPGPL